MRVKICGTTNSDDALAAAQAGADAIGFILVPTSPRAVSREEIYNMCSLLPPNVLSVGVVANEPSTFLTDLLRVCPLNALQFHGKETPEEVLAFKERVKVFKAIRVEGPESLEEIPKFKGVDAILLDAYVPDKEGGTGQTFDWSLAVQAKQYDIPIILAGGLTPQNVAQAIQQVDPYGVDVVSGVESERGKKDHDLVEEFIFTAKQAGYQKGQPEETSSAVPPSEESPSPENPDQLF